MIEKKLLLLGCSTLATLVAVEGGLRMFTANGPNRTVTAARLPGGDTANLARAIRHVAAMQAAPGTDPRWFEDDPEPLKRRPVDRQELERFNEYRRRGVFYTARSQYVWNRFFVESGNCGPSGFFRNYPNKVKVYEPAENSVHPPFRFPPNTTMVSGLVTNQFGLRGPPIDLVKPPKTIRIAFVGASTTENQEDYAFSYPERAVYWLNRFAGANHYEVRFEGMNAGREGIGSEDIAAIVRQELVPLNPDLVVYYEGANQFAVHPMISPPIAQRAALDPKDVITSHKLPQWVLARSALANLVDRSLLGFTEVGEPIKPAYRLKWPEGVDEGHPDSNNPNLPLGLPRIVKDLDSMRDALQPIGGQLVLSSFEWLAGKGLTLSPARHRYIYEQLNTTLWPLKYADIRRLSDFQNRVFRAYASSRKIGFLDVAAKMPQDPSLFVDAIHMTEVGERVKAWVVFQQLVPFVRAEIESGRLPRRTPPPRLPAPPSLQASETEVCGWTPANATIRIESDFSLASLEPSGKETTIDDGKPIKMIMPAAQWANGALIPLNLSTRLRGRTFVRVRARVLRGQVGFAVLDMDSTNQVEKTLDASDKPVEFYLPVLSPLTAASFVIRNTAPGKIRSEVAIEEAVLVTDRPPAAEEMITALILDRISPSTPQVSVVHQAGQVVITTSPVRWAYSVEIPVGLDASAGDGLRLKIRAKALSGTVSVGVLTADRKRFLVERLLRPTAETVEVTLALRGSPPFGPLVVRNAAEGNVVSAISLQAIGIYR